MLLDIEEISKDLQISIATSRLKKKNVDDLLNKLAKEKEYVKEEDEKDETYGSVET